MNLSMLSSGNCLWALSALRRESPIPWDDQPITIARRGQYIAAVLTGWAFWIS